VVAPAHRPGRPGQTPDPVSAAGSRRIKFEIM
jgi:hypothetical protein